jgi:hypothetical protein
MSTLTNKGPKGIASWTVNNGINVFDKKMIFVPVNKAGHWTLCVAVNPGLFANRNTEGQLCMVSDVDRKLPVYWSKALTLVFACSILFLDSLRIHDGEQCAAPIRDWLNSEWKRLDMGKGGNNKTPFINNLNMPMLTPKSKFRIVIVIHFRLHTLNIGSPTGAAEGEASDHRSPNSHRQSYFLHGQAKTMAPLLFHRGHKR